VVALQFIQAYRDSLAKIHGEMFFSGGYVHKPVAVAHVLVGEAEFFRSEEQGARSGGQMPADDGSARLQALERVLQVAMADRGGSNDEGAIGDGFGDGCEFPGIRQNVRRSDCGAGIFKSDFIGIHDPQMEKAEVAHGAGSCSDIEGIARVYQDDAKLIEFEGSGQAQDILSGATASVQGRKSHKQKGRAGLARPSRLCSLRLHQPFISLSVTCSIAL